MLSNILIFFLILLSSSNIFADLSVQINSLVKSSNTYQKGIYVTNLSKGKKVFDSNSTRLMKPASVLKIAVTTYLLNKLGPDYRFKTYLEASGIQGDSVKDLIIRGRGDPSFTTEDLWILLRQLKQYGIKKIENLYLDDSAFIDPEGRSGQSAYQAGVSALAFNFNTITFKVCPNQYGKPSRVSWDPWEYPLEISGSIIAAKKTSYGLDDLTKPGSSEQKFKLSGSIAAGAPCQDIYRSVESPIKYIANTTYHFLNYLDIELTGKLYREKYQKSVKQLTVHESKPLAQILADLNKFSSNFIAQQLLYQSGEINNQFDRKQGLVQLKSYLVRLGCSRDMVLADASGLSHDNRISAADLMKIIIEAYRNPKIRAEFLASLAVDGQVGTLSKRKYPDRVNLRGKTGTINGVDTLLGVVQASSGDNYAFVLLHNQVRNAWKSKELEDKLVKLLYQYG